MDLLLKILEVEDVSQDYINWFSDNDVIKYSDNQFKEFTFEKQKDYVKNCRDSNDIELFGIFDCEKHIGNIILRGINSPHKKCDLSYVIGNKEYWNKGVGSFAVCEMIKKAANEYNLNKLYAGIADANIGSKKVLENNGFKLEGVRRKHLIYNGKFYDQLDFGLLLK